MKRTIALGIAGATLVTAGVGGVAFAADSNGPQRATLAATTSQPSAPAGSTAKGKHPRRALAGRALHGTFTVDRKGTPTVVDVQRGTVTTSVPGSITVKSKDGFEATYALTDATKIRKEKKAATAAELPVGTTVGVLADDGNGHPTARVVRVAGKH
ncbi:MAG TPA: hypothetical protein VLR26_00085 [Frankiaceae bacterium]|nr:hypothetical protein [Frankiaceae bacterium]